LRHLESGHIDGRNLVVDDLRRGRNEGSIFQRGDGKWVATISLGTNGDGKRHRRAFYGETKREVQDALDRLKTEKTAGTQIVSVKTTVAEALDNWLEALEGRGTVRSSTLANYRRVVKLHIRPRSIGGKWLQKLLPTDVEGLFTEMARDKVGPNPRRLAHIVLSLALKQYVKQGAIGRNVCEVVDAPQVRKAEIQPLSQKQAGALLMAAEGDRLEPCITWRLDRA